ncbi:MAG: hypothetical protein LBC73_05645 [Oscillospiraceae bacterium]|jgi:methylmalonyl-CoA mutase cobalamin-binding subunit|nr:hypothetical protein [Oscillospiraceae bacterium]
MDAMNKNEMLSYLEEINARLAAVDAESEIVLAGGAVVVLVHEERDGTKDFDVIYKPKDIMKEIINDIAE